MKALRFFILAAALILALFPYVARGQTTIANVITWHNYSLLYPVPGDARQVLNQAAYVGYEKIHGKVIYSVIADSLELDSLAQNRQRAWTMTVRYLHNNYSQAYDSVTIRRTVGGAGLVNSYTDTTLIILDKKQVNDVWPGLDFVFYAGDSMAVNDTVKVYLINKKWQ